MERVLSLYQFYNAPFPNQSNSPTFPHEPSHDDFRLRVPFRGSGFDEIGQLFDDCPPIQNTYFSAMEKRSQCKVTPIAIVMSEAAGRNRQPLPTVNSNSTLFLVKGVKGVEYHKGLR